MIIGWREKNVSRDSRKREWRWRLVMYLAGLWAWIYEARFNYVTTKVICSIFFFFFLNNLWWEQACLFSLHFMCFTNSLFGETRGKFVLLTIFSHRICLKNSSLYNNTACLYLQSLFLHFADKSYLTFKLDREKIC